MADVPAREGLTTWLVAELRAKLEANDPMYYAGDGVAPEQAGWSGGQPGAGEFKAYTVLKELMSVPAPGRTLTEPASWVFPYQLTSWGTLREQAAAVADLATSVIAEIGAPRGDDSPVPGYGIQIVHMTALGPAERSDQSNPPMWSRTDSLEVRVARARARR